MELNKLVEKLEFPEKIESALVEKLRRSARELSRIAEQPYQNEDGGFPLLRRRPLTRLAAVVRLLTERYEGYRELGLTDEIIFDTFRDVTLRAKLYEQATGMVGLSKDDVLWFRHMMNCAIIQVGSLQFQRFEMVYLDREFLGEPYMEFRKDIKRTLPIGMPVLNCHIPRGADLSVPAVEDSLALIDQLTRTLFPEHRTVICYSWLLYPPMVARLPKNSRIKGFARRFQVIGQCDDREQALENLAVGSGERETALQTMAKRHPESFGFACGVLNL